MHGIPQVADIPVAVFDFPRRGTPAWCLTLFPQRQPNLAFVEILSTSDEEALRRDWERVGQDLRQAIANYDGSASSQPESAD
jgi:hypothetical protein